MFYFSCSTNTKDLFINRFEYLIYILIYKIKNTKFFLNHWRQRDLNSEIYFTLDNESNSTDSNYTLDNDLRGILAKFKHHCLY